MADGKIELKVSAEDMDVAYITLPDHPRETIPGIVKKTVWLRDLMDHNGPDVHLDFDDKNRLIGIEILA